MYKSINEILNEEKTKEKQIQEHLNYIFNIMEEFKFDKMSKEDFIFYLTFLINEIAKYNSK